MAITCLNVEMVAQFSESVGYKSGLALDRQQLHDHARTCPEYDGFFLDRGDGWIRLRPEIMESIAAWLLWKVGYLETPDTIPSQIRLFHKYKADPKLQALFVEVCKEFKIDWPSLIDRASLDGTRKLDPTTICKKIALTLGAAAGRMALELATGLAHDQRADPFSEIRGVDWSDKIALRELFNSSKLGGAFGKFLDQRFIDYLAANPDALGSMHWRKFEALTAQYFDNSGYQVAIGPGRADGGVDVRVWRADDNIEVGPPLILIQCKRHRSKIEQMIVKSLYADVLAEQAESGLIVTTSSLAPGAKAIIQARSYPVEAADKTTLRRWLKEMRRPNSGIFMA